MISHEELEEFICQFPVYQYAFFSPKEIDFSFRVRWICEKECERYNSTWACPPAVGTVEECRKRCLDYKDVFCFPLLQRYPMSSILRKHWLPERSTKKSQQP